MEQRFTQTQTTGLTQVQRQVMSPQQLLLVKLLEKSVTDLEDTVKSEIDSNEALEEDDGAILRTNIPGKTMTRTSAPTTPPMTMCPSISREAA